jgi:hypothetical protein
MQHVLQNAPFMGLVESDGYQDPKSKEKPPKVINLAFGPIFTKKGMFIQNVKQGPEDGTLYEVGKVYDVPVSVSVFNNALYFRSVGTSTMSREARETKKV